MKYLRRTLCLFLISMFCFCSTVPVIAAKELPVSQAFVQGEKLFVYLQTEPYLTAELRQETGIPSIPAFNGIQPVPQSGCPVTYCLLVDTSNSMSSKREKVQSFASALIEMVPPGTYFMVLDFNDNTKVVQDKTQKADTLMKSLQELSYNTHATDVSQGILQTFQYLRTVERKEGELIHVVLISDGVTEKVEQTPGLEAARQQIQSSPDIILHTLGLALIGRDSASAQALHDLSTLGTGIHAELAANDHDGTQAAADITAYSDSLSVLTFALDKAISSPFTGNIFFLSDKTGQQTLYAIAPLENIPILSVPLAPTENTFPGTFPSEAFPPQSMPAENLPAGEPPSENAASVTPAQQPDDTTSSLTTEADDKNNPFSILLLLLLVMSAGVLLALYLHKRYRHTAVAPAQGICMRLEVFSGTYTGRQHEWRLHNPLYIGSSQSCDLIWDAFDVEPRHARIFVADGMVFLEDLSMSHSTLLGGMPLHRANRLRSGDEITVGSVRFTLRF